MEDYRPPYSVTEKMLELVASVSEKVGQLGSRDSMNARPHLRKHNRIRSVHASLKIEANHLSLDEVADVVDGKAVYGNQQEIREVKNAYAAYEKLPVLDPYSEQDLLTSHRIMTDQILKDAGQYRIGEEGVFENGRCIFMAPPAAMVPELMRNLFAWMKRARGAVHPLILSAVFHYEFVFIHPFSDGNGRMARLWHTLLLSRWKDFFAYLPLESQIEKCQEQYYAAIAHCHSAGASTEFIEFMLQQIDQCLTEAIEQIRTQDTDASEQVRDLLSFMEAGVPYTANSIMAALDLKSKETFRKNYVNPAMSAGLVEMTVPDKPTSRNQRYVRKNMN